MTLLLRLQGASATAAPMNKQNKLLQARIFVGFFMLGLLNNSAYVIMIAGANEIAASAVGLVYLFAIGPTIIVKLTAPYWFHLVGYSIRFWVAAVLMACSFITVGLSKSTAKQLLGVGLVAVQGGLGEASALGLCSLCPNQLSLTAWSSGTGFAGIGGYAWVAVLHYWLGLSYTATLLLANMMPIIWLAVFHLVLQRVEPSTSSKVILDYERLPLAAEEAADDASHADAGDPALRSRASSRQAHSSSGGIELSPTSSPSEETHEPCVHAHHHQHKAPQHLQQQQRLLLYDVPISSELARGDLAPAAARSAAAEHEGSAQPPAVVLDAANMSFMQRLRAVRSLWPYMVPLFVVYFAEYAMQSGTWTAIGFPVTSPEARHRFYLYSNWVYQAGVCVSRSSGLLYQANRLVLWIMPGMQCLLLVFFSIDAVTHAWYGWSLLLLCFLAGLLGGAVYVNSFTLLTKEVDPALKEFSLSAACVADSLGIACADATAIVIQGCLFRWQNLSGAAYSCGDG